MGCFRLDRLRSIQPETAPVAEQNHHRTALQIDQDLIWFGVPSVMRTGRLDEAV